MCARIDVIKTINKLLRKNCLNVERKYENNNVHHVSVLHTATRNRSKTA